MTYFLTILTSVSLLFIQWTSSIGVLDHIVKDEGVTDLLLVGSCNKLRTVPEAGCRFNCGAIYECRNDECDPSEDIVH